MSQALIEFIVSAAVIVVAGTVLARAANRIADLTGLGRLLIGSVLVAGATSLPELSVDVNAAARGLDDLAVGDLMGSSLANLLILAVADLFHQSRGRMLSRASAAHALSGAIAILLTGLVSIAMILRVGVGVWGIGAGSALVFAVYALGIRMVYQDQMLARPPRPPTEGAPANAGKGGNGGRRAAAVGSSRSPEAARAETESQDRGNPRSPLRRRSLVRAAAVFGIAAVAILFAAPFVATSAARIADLSGLGQTFVGTTLVALSTSLPEIVAVIATVRMGAFDLAVGNIFGSNALNMALMLPVDLASSGPLLANVSRTHAVTGLWIVVIMSVAIAGQLYHVEKRRRLIEPDALVVIGLVIAALATVYTLR